MLKIFTICNYKFNKNIIPNVDLLQINILRPFEKYILLRNLLLLKMIRKLYCEAKKGN